MSDRELVSMGSKSLEDLKKINEYSAEYWSAREIQPLLGYTQWRRFEDAVKRAITSCKSSGNEPTHHFANAGKPIAGGRRIMEEITEIMSTKLSEIVKRLVEAYQPLRIYLFGSSARGDTRPDSDTI